MFYSTPLSKQSYPSNVTQENAQLKWGLPMIAWKHIADFLFPEENIHLSHVNLEETNYLFCNTGYFLIPPSSLLPQASRPSWYNRNKFVLRYTPWSHCPETLRQKYFNLIANVRWIEISSLCCNFPMDVLFKLFEQNTNTLRKITISNSERCHSVVSADALQIPKLDWDCPLQHHPIVMKKLETLHLEGGKSIHWMFILSHMSLHSIKNILCRLPPVVDLLSFYQSSKNFSRVRKLIIGFFSNFPSGKNFHLAAEPTDEPSRLIVSSCLQWIASGCPSSKSFVSINLEGPKLQPLLLCLYRHLSWISACDANGLEISQRLNAFCSTFTTGSDENSFLKDNVNVVTQNDNGFSTSNLYNDDPKKKKYQTLNSFAKSEPTQKPFQPSKKLLSRQPHLCSMHFLGCIGPWMELVYLYGFFGTHVNLFAKEFHGPLEHPFTGIVLKMFSPHIETIKFDVTANTPWMSCNDLMVVKNLHDTRIIEVSHEFPKIVSRPLHISTISFPHLSRLVLFNVTLSSIPLVADTLSRIQPDSVENLQGTLGGVSISSPSHTINVANGELSANAVDDQTTFANVSSRSLLSFALPSSEESFSLELFFTEEDSTSRGYLKMKEAIELIKKLVLQFSVTSILVCPCPDIDLFYDYHKIIRGTHYIMRPVSRESSGSPLIELTSDCHSCLSSKIRLATPSISHITVYSLLCLKWVMELASADERSSRFLALKYLDVNLLLESHVSLSFMIPLFITSSLDDLNIEKCLCNIFHYTTLCDAITLFTDTLDCMTVKCFLPLLLQLCPLHNSITLFLELKNRVEYNLMELSEHYHYNVDLDITLNSFPHDASHPLYTYVQRAWDTLLQSKLFQRNSTETTDDPLVRYLKECQYEKLKMTSLNSNVNRKRLQVETFRFQRALGHLGVMMDSPDPPSSLLEKSSSTETEPLEVSDLISGEKKSKKKAQVPIRKEYPEAFRFLLQQRLEELDSDFEINASQDSLHDIQHSSSMLSHTVDESIVFLKNRLRLSLYHLRQQLEASCHPVPMKQNMNPRLDDSVTRIYESSVITLAESSPHLSLCIPTASTTSENHFLNFDWLPIMWTSSNSSFSDCFASLPYFDGGKLVFNIRKEVIDTPAASCSVSSSSSAATESSSFSSSSSSSSSSLHEDVIHT